MPDLFAVSAEWGAGMGEALAPFNNFFQVFPEQAQYFPCPRHCGCAHHVFHCDDGTIRARCRCKRWRCHDLKLTPEDITLWELNRPKLARAISKALGLTSKYEEIGPPNTAQIGTWSADAVPAFLTIQWDEREFRHVVASLVALYMYMRHWTAAWLKRERSALYKQLPWSFGLGHPLPVHRSQPAG